MSSELRRSDALVREGNTDRLRNLIRRAERGERLVIGFIGGSITQGSLATEPEKCYASRVYSWWARRFPSSIFVYVNAGIGATTSMLAACRAEEDLLSEKPDFVVVDFSVNDENTAAFEESYEGLIRRIWLSESKPAIILLHNCRYDDGSSAEEIHDHIGAHYNLPAVSLHRLLWDKLKEREIRASELSSDGLHPNDAGHEIVASMITDFIESISETVAFPGTDVFPEPLTRNRFEKGFRLQNLAENVRLTGFTPDQAPAEGIWDCFKKGWTADNIGDTIEFTVHGCWLAVWFRRTPALPAPAAVAVVDGDGAHAVLLDASFNETWGDKAELVPILNEYENRDHTVTIRVLRTHQNDQKPFYMMALTGTEL